MTYEEAKLRKQELEDMVDTVGLKLKEFEKYGKSSLGTTPDHVREMPEWIIAKKEFDQAFAELRNFNGWFVKTFKKEYVADRNKKREA